MGARGSSPNLLKASTLHWKNTDVTERSQRTAALFALKSFTKPLELMWQPVLHTGEEKGALLVVLISRKLIALPEDSNSVPCFFKSDAWLVFPPEQSRHCEVKPKLQKNLQGCGTKGNWKTQWSEREKTFGTGTCEIPNNFDWLLQFCSKTILWNSIFLWKDFCCLKDMDNVNFSLEDHTIKYWLAVLIQRHRKK